MPTHQGAHNSCFSPASNASTMEPHSPEESKSTNKGGRQRLKPWLEAQINSGKYPGLGWIDPVRRIFSVRWKHSGRSSWREEDGLIFKAWAEHTGRYREGIDESDYPGWKTRLRCAINKQKPDIQEIKEMSCYDEPNPYRVFQFHDKKGSGSNGVIESNSSSPGSASEAEAFSPPPQRPSVIQVPSGGNIPTTVSESFDTKPTVERQEECLEAQVSSLTLGSDLQQVNIQDLVPASDMSITDISVDSNINSFNPESMDTDSLKGAGGQPACLQIKNEPTEMPDPMYFQTAISDHEMMVTVRFRTEIVQQIRVTNPYGCRVFYGDVPYDIVWNPELFGSRDAEQIPVPYSPGQLKSLQQDKYTETVLKGLELGVNLVMDKRNIYIERRCKTRIITAPPNQAEKQTKKVERQERLKVFDFTRDFLPAFIQYQQGEGPRPSPQVIVAIGQDFRADVEPYSDLFVSLTVCHGQASHLLSQHTAETTTPDLSHSNHFDQCMDVLKDRKFTIPITNMNQTAAPEPAFEDPLPLM